MLTQLNDQTILFQTIQFNLSTQFSSIRPIDKTLSGADTQGQSRPGSDDNKGVLRIPQISSMDGSSPSNCLVSYPGQSYPSTEMKSVYSTAPEYDPESSMPLS